MPRAALRIPDSGIFIDEKNRRFQYGSGGSYLYSLRT